MIKPEQLEVMKRKFAERFIDAVGSGSMEAMMDLLVHHGEYVTLTGDTGTNPAKYRRGLRKQCTWFLNEYKAVLAEAGDAIRNENFSSVKLHRMGEVTEFEDGTQFAQISAVFIQMQGETLANGDIASIGFRVEDAVIVGSEMRVNSFFGVRASRSIDSQTKKLPRLEELGFRVLPQNGYAEVMENQPPGYLRILKSNDRALFHEGDLAISASDIRLLDHQSVLVSGDLVVDGVLDAGDIGQFLVLGDVRASSVLMGGDTSCLFKGITTVEDALVILSGSGSVAITPAGPLVYNGSEAAEVRATPDTVTVCIDPEGGQEFGDAPSLLDARFLGDHDGLDVHAVWTALVSGEGLGLR